MARIDGVKAGVRPARLAGARLRPIGVIRSVLKERSQAPRQASEGAPDAWIEVQPWALDALHGVVAGDELLVITWLHRARRDVFKVHPRSDPRNPISGVFNTRSPDRPNPLGLHPVVVRALEGRRLRVGPIEAIDGTPVVDIKSRSGGESIGEREAAARGQRKPPTTKTASRARR